MVQRGVVKLQYVAMEEHIADVLTKPLARMKFEYLLQREIPMDWGTTTDSLTLEINPFNMQEK